jgi:hypothetical protein
MKSIVKHATLGLLLGSASVAFAAAPGPLGDLSLDPNGYVIQNTGRDYFVGSLPNYGFDDTFTFSLSSALNGTESFVKNSGVTFTSATLNNVALSLDSSGNLYGSAGLLSGANTLVIHGVTGEYGGSYQYNVGGTKIAAAVPEPETFAMLLAGLGLIGALTRRRNRVELAT